MRKDITQATLASMVTLSQHYMPTLAGCWRQPWLFKKKSQDSQGWLANPEPALSQHYIKNNGKLI